MLGCVSNASAQACPSTSGNYPCGYVSGGAGISVFGAYTWASSGSNVEITIPSQFSSLTVSQDNSYVWAESHSSSSNATTVSAIDTSTATIASPVTGLSPIGPPPYSVTSLAVTPDNAYVYVQSYFSPQLQVINTKTMQAAAIPVKPQGGLTPFKSLDGLTIANGYVYNADSCTTQQNAIVPCISLVSIATNQVAGVIQPTGLPTPYADGSPSLSSISVLSGSNIAYVGLSIYSPSREQTISYLAGVNLTTGQIINSAQLDGYNVIGLLQTSDGRQVYVSTQYAVYSVDTQTYGSAVVDTGGYPSGIALSPDGSELFVSEGDSNLSVRVFNTSTNASIGTGGFNVIDGGGPIALMHNLPVPVIDQSLSPNAAPAGSSEFTLTVNGTGFVPSSTVNWNGYALPTTYVSPGRLTAIVPPPGETGFGVIKKPSRPLAVGVSFPSLTNEGTASVTVTNPGPGGGTSNVAYFSITSPTPSVNLSNNSIQVGVAPDNVIAADFNDDGIPDLAVLNACGSDSTCASAGTVTILLGTGSGSFTSQGPVNVGNVPIMEVAGDFNGDGKLDLAVLSNDGTVFFLPGNGDGTFGSPIQTKSGRSQALLAYGDFNGDGKLDLLVLGQYSGSYALLLGNGNGSFTSHQNSSGLATSYALTAADFNGDGILDFAAAGISGVNNTLTTFLGNGDGTFAPGVTTNWTGAQALYSSLVTGDFNSDGKPDVALISGQGGSTANTNEILIFNGKGDGTFDAPSGVQSSALNALEPADLNGDNVLDFAVSNLLAQDTGGPTEGSVQVLVGQGSESYQAGPATTNAGIGLYPPMAIADFNGDGRPDIAAVNYSNNTVSILLQVGTASLSAMSLAFGEVYNGTISASQTVTLSNTGSANLLFGPISITGTNANEFNQTNTCAGSPSLTLAPGAECSVTVVFVPTAIGNPPNASAATLSFGLNGPGSTVALSGTGVSVQITTQPQSQSIAPGQTATMTVAATGIAALAYQWYQGSSGETSHVISGATGPTFTTPALNATTSYWVLIKAGTASSEMAASMTATITVVPPPSISAQPLSQSVVSGHTATLNVTASGTGTLTYQWYLGLSGDTSNPINGATNSTFTTPALTANSNYWAKVSESGPPAQQTNSATASITVVQPLTISAQPISQSIAPGQIATVSVTATGTSPLTYQWYRGVSGDTSNPINGATNSTFTTPALTASTDYWVKVLQSGPPPQQANSQTAVITVVPLPAISAQPSGQSVVPGQTATLSITASSSANLTYQWYVGLSGDTSNPIQGATNSSYTTPPVTTSTSYWVLVSVAGVPADQIMSASAVVVAGAVFPGQSQTVDLEFPYNPNWPVPSTIVMSCTQVKLPNGSLVPMSNYNMSCDVSPSTFTNSLTSQSLKVTITTSDGATAALDSNEGKHLPRGTGPLPISGLAILVLLIPGISRRKISRLLVSACVAMFTLGLISCGGHFTAPSNVPTNPNAVTPAGSYSIVVTATDSQGAPGFQQTSLIVPLTVSPTSH